MERESDVGSSETGSGRDTPRSLDQDTYTLDTPGPMPTYQYSKKELYDIEKLPASKVIPPCLAKEFIIDGVWDPERWHRGDSGSRGSSPLTLGDVRERRLERDGLRRASASASLDPKERLKEEKDGIVLSPQRRSFGTGCHVTHQPLLQRALSSTVDYKDPERTDRRDQRRIGSGRIQIDRGSDRDRDFRSNPDRDFRSNRDNDRGLDRDFRNHREGDRVIERDFRNNRDSERDRDFRGSRDPRDRFEREDRDRDRRHERDRIFISRRDVDERPRDRDFRDFRHNNRRDRHDSMGRREEEPEWFSSGPISKSDTIELHGFDKSVSRDRKDSELESKEEKQNEDVFEEEESHEEEKENDKDVINVADRNGSLETNESSSPETNQSDLEMKPAKTPPLNTLFDFNEFFNIPVLLDDPVLDSETNTNIGGSRLFQLFNVGHGSQGGSQEHSRRSSLNDEFGYLNDLLNGSKSPVIPSPPPPSANSIFDHANFLSHFPGGDKQQNIEFGIVGQKLNNMNNNPFVTALINNAASLEKNRGSPTGNRSTQETEAKLKALLFGNIDSNPSSGTASPGFSSGSPLNVPGRVKTLAELEADMQIAGKPGQSVELRRMTPPNVQTQHTAHIQRSKSPEEHDLTAFNKLISLMKAGAATPMESPKIKSEERPMSPITGQPLQIQQHLQQQQLQQQLQQQHQLQQQLQQQQLHKQEPLTMTGQQFMQSGRPGPGDLQFTENYLTQSGPSTGQINDAATAQKQFLEALQRNKEQQLQIRQAAIENMRLQQQQNPAGTPQTTHPPQQPPPNQTQVHVQEPRRVPIGDSLANFLQASQVSQAQELRRISAGDQVMNFLKANPTIITKPASPTPPPQQPMVNIVEPPASTPRVPTPRRQSSVSPVLQQAFFSQQTPGSPRVPSPITIINHLTSSRTKVEKHMISVVQPSASVPLRRHSSVSPVNYQALLVQQSTTPFKILSPGRITSPQRAPSPRRIPSPIMFSQQPPMHLSAPSPIHPSQTGPLSQSPTNQPTNTNTTASIRPPSVRRVPSPQELVMHTQAILQNALIKKQLEDQKERFYKKQQERVKSPNPTGTQQQAPPPQNKTEVSTAPAPVASMTPVSVAFTPTSVIRKMHSEKASEKEKQKSESTEKSDSETTDTQKVAPVKSIGQDSTERHLGDTVRTEAPTIPLPVRTDVPPPMIQGIPPPPVPNQVLPNLISISGTPAVLAGLPSFSAISQTMSHLPPPPPLPIVSTHLPPPSLLSPPHSGVTLSGIPLTNLVTADQTEAGKSQIRALVGQPPPVPVQLQNVPTSLQMPGRPILKGVSTSVAASSIAITHQMPPPLTNQQRPLLGGGGTVTTPVTGSVDINKLLQLQQQRQVNTSPNIAARTPVTPTSPYGIQLTGRLPLASTPVVGPVSPQPLPTATNPFLVQQMMQTGNPRGIGQISQLAAIQQRMVDPRLQASVRPPLPRVIPQMLSPRNAMNTPPNFNPRPLNTSVALQKANVSAGFTPVSMVTALNGNNNFKQDANLMKWFGTDMLKTQLPNMPPLPAQGQRVMTVDEIERS